MSSQTRWPSSSSYVSAVQHPGSAFGDTRLRAGRVREGLLGLPASASGQNAIVFPVSVDDGEVAVRCFTTPALDGRERYEALSHYLESHPCDVMARARWLDDGITVDGERWPIVEMEWVAGQPLHQAVAGVLGSPEQLGAMSDAWLEVTRDLRGQRIAHGDLQHGNVLVDGDSRLRLVDFDGVWIPPIAGLAPREVGHPNYQHPERIATGAWGEYIDAFSAFVVYLSLRALAADPGLWEHHNGENLFLSAADYQAPGATPVWDRLSSSPAPDVAQLAALLAGLCRITVNIATDLDSLLETRQIPDAAAYLLAGTTSTNTWWQSDGTEPTLQPAGESNQFSRLAPIFSASWPDEADVHPAGDRRRSQWPWFAAAAIAIALVAGIGIAIVATPKSDTDVESAEPETSATASASAATVPRTEPTIATTPPPAAPPLAAPTDYAIGVIPGSCNGSTCLAYGTWVDNSSNEVRFDGYLDGNGPIPGSSGTPTPNREGFGYAVDGSATAVEAPIGTRFCTYIVAVDANQVTSTRSETVCATINASGEVLYG